MSGELGDGRATRQRELALFLRARRDEVRPEDVGLETRGRRRVQGLRRHEVADLAGVSVTWYTWLEQARDIRASAQSLDAVCRALRLDEDSRRYVRQLAGLPVVEAQVTPTEVGDDLQDLLDDLKQTPACITTGPSDLLAWNEAFCALFGDPNDLPPARRNTHWLHLTSELLRHGVRDLEKDLHDSVARLRAEATRYADDPRFQEVVRQLCAENPAFEKAWNTQHVREFHGPHVETFDHPSVGELRIQEFHLRPVDQPALTLIILRAVDDPTRAALSRLMDDARSGR